MIIMKIQLLYILDCPWCLKTKKLIKESLKDLKVKANIEEILIDSDKKARVYNFEGSPTVRINGKDIQEKINKGQCLPCEDLVENSEKMTKFIKQECKCGCRVYFYKDKQYPYPPKEMIKETIIKNLD